MKVTGLFSLCYLLRLCGFSQKIKQILAGSSNSDKEKNRKVVGKEDELCCPDAFSVSSVSCYLSLHILT